MNKDLTPQITSMIVDLWDNLDPVTKSQHVLSNSELYQRVQLLRETVAAFTRLENEHDRDS